MALLGIVSKERRKSKTPLERAALAFDMANAVAGMTDKVGGLFKGASQEAAAAADPLSETVGLGGLKKQDIWDPERYELLHSDTNLLPRQYSNFRVTRGR